MALNITTCHVKLADLCTREAIINAVTKLRDAGHPIDTLVLADDIYAVVSATTQWGPLSTPSLLTGWTNELRDLGVRLICSESAQKSVRLIAPNDGAEAHPHMSQRGVVIDEMITKMEYTHEGTVER